MTYPVNRTSAAPAASRPSRSTILIVAVVGALGWLSWAVSSPSAVIDGRAHPVPATSSEAPGAAVFDDAVPDVAGLDPDLFDAVRRAATAAADDGITFHVTSGRRSPEYQDQLLREAVARYGSEREAARWVATADTSLHVSGDAIDIGHADATAWLSKHGAGYGLCQIYRNEPWHYERRPDAVDRGCPRMYADPTQDPRMQH